MVCTQIYLVSVKNFIFSQIIFQQLSQYLLFLSSDYVYFSSESVILIISFYIICYCFCIDIQVDLVSHRLLTSLGQAGHGRRAEERMSDATMACKKLAVQHPVLLLR
jgi:hypothetical protein